MLTEEQISLIQERKAEQRRAEKESNAVGSHRYCCATCFHLKTQNCDGLSSLGKVCDGWFDPNGKIQGLRYWRQEVGFAKNRAGVMQATAEFLAGRKQTKEPRRIQEPEAEANLFSRTEP